MAKSSDIIWVYRKWERNSWSAKSAERTNTLAVSQSASRSCGTKTGLVSPGHCFSCETRKEHLVTSLLWNLAPNDVTSATWQCSYLIDLFLYSGMKVCSFLEHSKLRCVYLYGDGQKLVVGIQVQQDERSRQIVLLSIYYICCETVQQLIIHHKYVSSLREHSYRRGLCQVKMLLYVWGVYNHNELAMQKYTWIRSFVLYSHCFRSPPFPGWDWLRPPVMLPPSPL